MLLPFSAGGSVLRGFDRAERAAVGAPRGQQGAAALWRRAADSLVRKTHLLRDFVLKMIILPRQARDKHTENSKQRCGFSQAPDEGHEGLRQRHPPVKRPGQLC